MKVYVAGHTGLVGWATVEALQIAGHEVWLPPRRFDLRDSYEVNRCLKAAATSGVDAVVLAAARVGGIGANTAFPVEFYHDNVLISTNVIIQTHNHGIHRLVNLGSSCIYPRGISRPIREEDLLTGELEPTNEAYAIAKIGAIKLVQAYRRQYEEKYISLMPTNLYGENDKFNIHYGHVIPSLIAKFEKAKHEGTPVVLWGTGSAKREFLHVSDLARAIVIALEKYDDDLWLNVGSDEEVTIAELVKLISGITNFKGDIFWDSTKPDGTPRKKLDCSRMQALGWKPTIDLKTGLLRTIRDFQERGYRG